MLTGKFKRKYRSKAGNNVFVYTVSGNEKELSSYQDAQGDNFILDEESGKPLFFTTRYVDDNIELDITQNNNVVVKDDELSKLQSMVQQYGADVAKLVLLQRTMKTAAAE